MFSTFFTTFQDSLFASLEAETLSKELYPFQKEDKKEYGVIACPESVSIYLKEHTSWPAYKNTFERQFR